MYGNARVESGFSVNRDMLIENFKKVSLVAQRQVYDAIKAKGGILNVNITSEMLTYAKQSHTRYQECLKQAKEKIRAKEMQAKERKRVAEQIKVLEAKHSMKENFHQELKTIDREIAELKILKKQ